MILPERLALKWDICWVLFGICQKIAECSGYCVQIESTLIISFCPLLLYTENSTQNLSTILSKMIFTWFPLKWLKRYQLHDSVYEYHEFNQFLCEFRANILFRVVAAPNELRSDKKIFKVWQPRVFITAVNVVVFQWYLSVKMDCVLVINNTLLSINIIYSIWSKNCDYKSC